MRENASPSRRQRGQSLVEFAAGSLVLVLLLVGAGELGRAFFFAVSIQGAAREAARSAAWFSPGDITNPNPSLSDAAILASVNGTLAGSGLSAVSRPQDDCLAGSGFEDGPPYADADYPTTPNLVWVYACYQRPDSTRVGRMAAAPAGYAGGEVQVTLLVEYGPATGFFVNQLGRSGIHLNATTHMRIQGST